MPKHVPKTRQRHAKELTLEQRAAQCLGIPLYAEGTHGQAPKVIQWIAKHGGVGLVHIGQGTVKEAQSLCRLLKSKGKNPPICAADCEHGVAHAFQGGCELPWAMNLGASKDIVLAKEAGRVLGEEARGCGLEMVFGPVADILQRKDVGAIGTRAFGSNPSDVSDMVASFCEGMREGGIVACPKHFPGHGGVRGDSHTEQGLVDTVDLRRLEEEYILPFVAAQAACVMTAHVVFCEVDKVPASFSRPIHDLARQHLGEDVIIITDSLLMVAAKAMGPQSVVLALCAGADIVLHPGDPSKAVQSIVQAVRDGKLEESQLNQSVDRILRWKARVRDKPLLGRVDVGGLVHQRIAQRCANQGVVLWRPCPFCEQVEEGRWRVNKLWKAIDVVVIVDRGQAGVMAPVMENVFASMLLEACPGGRLHCIDSRTSDKIVDGVISRWKAWEGSCVLVVAQTAVFWKGSCKLPSSLQRIGRQISKSHKIDACVAFGAPEALEGISGGIRLVGWGPDRFAQTACAHVLLGELNVGIESGVWPRMDE